jgi:hypothetical protein
MAKNKISEDLVAEQFVSTTNSNVFDLWLFVRRTIKDWPGSGERIAEDPEKAMIDLCMAYTAKQFLEIRRLFPDQQAKRIEDLIFKSWERKLHNRESTAEIKAYLKGGDQSINLINVSLGTDPANAIPHRLLYRWMGDYLCEFVMVVNYRTIETFSPTLLVQTRMILRQLTELYDWSWERIKENYELMAGL